MLILLLLICFLFAFFFNTIETFGVIGCQKCGHASERNHVIYGDRIGEYTMSKFQKYI